MIREATRDDLQVLAVMVYEQAVKNHWPEQSGMEPDAYTVVTVLRYHLRNKDAAIFVNEGEGGSIIGFIVVALLPFVLDIRRHACHEKMWGGEGVKELREAVDKWAKANDACSCVMGCYEQSDAPRLRRVV